MSYLVEDLYSIPSAKGHEVEYRGKKYRIYGEFYCKISKIYDNDANEPYDLVGYVDCDAKEIGEDNYVLLCWSADMDEPFVWFENIMSTRDWIDDVDYVVDDIFPPEEWENLTSDEVDKMIQTMRGEE